MINALTDKYVGKLLAYGSFLTTILVVSGVVTDPVNTPKFLIIGILGCSTFAIFLTSNMKRTFYEDKLLLALIIFFVGSLVVSSILSESPKSQIFYGVYGRNNGLLTYIFLTMIMIVAASLNSVSSFNYIVRALVFAGLINIAYCAWVLLFGDFVGWNNPYGNILGTFGNPNFIGAFLGIFFSTSVAIVCDSSVQKRLRILFSLLLPICAYEIIESSAIQGRVVAAFGTAFVIYLYLRSRFSKMIQSIYLIVCGILGSLAVGGALQIGPLTSFIYKNSVSLRGQYWLAAWNTGNAHPFSGVGMDGFGDWYRRMRDAHALEIPGVNTVVNAAHNVPLDLFAFGGWPLLIGYVSILIYAGSSMIKVIRSAKEFNYVFGVISAAWLGYQLQSIISINQIGLAVWGWVLSGILIGYEKSRRIKEFTEIASKGKQNKARSNYNKNLPAQTPLVAGLGAVIGLLLALPPLTADALWRSSQTQQKLTLLEQTMKPGYFNPPNAMKFQLNVQTLEQSSLFDLSRKYALEAIKWNPDNFDSWKVLYYIKNSTNNEKELALANMRRLDPLNPELKLLK